MKKVLSIILTVVMLLSTLSVFSVLSVSAAPARGDGEGRAIDAPKGSGTQTDPYLISSLANLNWLKAEIINIEAGKYQYWKQDANFPTGSNGTFAGVYFEQTADIDLGGSDFTAIGGYMHDSYLHGQTMAGENIDKHGDYNYFAAFSGIYNGNGYKIHNGTISGYQGDSEHTNDKWATGLFGGIYGATLKNIVLENITVDSYNMITGGLVGIARSPLNPNDENAGKADFNLIENCVVRNCTVTSTLPKGPTTASGWDFTGYNLTAETPDYTMSGHRLGGLIGLATGTTIRGCKNDNTLVLADYGQAVVGGIVAMAGNGILMENCVNDGTIRYVKKTNSTITAVGEVSFGGLVGTVMSRGTNAYCFGSPEKLTAAKGSVKILNSYNAGGFENNVALDGQYAAISKNTTHYWGGIVGSAINLPYVATEDWYLIENCHNTFEAKTSSAWTLTVSNNTTRVAGILSGGWASNGNEWSGMTVRDCFSVDVTQCAYNGTNEVRWHTTAVSSAATGKVRYATVKGANAILANGSATTNSAQDKTYATRALTDYIYETTDGTTYTLSTTVKFQDVIDAIDATVAKMHARGTDKVAAIGYQEALDGSTYRVVLGINSLRWYSVGAEVSLTVDGQAADTAADKSKDVVYNAVTGKVDGNYNTWTADDLYVGYLSTLDITDVAAEGVSVYTIKTYTQEQGEGHAKVYGDVIVVTFTNGTFTSAVKNPAQS